MKITETSLPDVKVLTPNKFYDHRGSFTIDFDSYWTKVNLGFEIVQINRSFSHSKVIRGLHFQYPPKSQSKIINILEGKIMDVVVDIRLDSPTFGKYITFILSEDNNKMIFIPRGFAHGFITLSETTTFQYYVDNDYSPEHESGIIYNDVTLQIPWGINNPIINSKDLSLPSFNNITKYTKLQYESNK